MVQSASDYYEMKFSAQQPNQLGVLTPRDLQLFELVQNPQTLKSEDKITSEKHKQKAQASQDVSNKVTRSFVRKTYIDVPDIETFEWPPVW